MATIAVVALAAADPLGAEFGATLSPRFGLDRLGACFLLLIVAVGAASAVAGMAAPNGRKSRACGWLGLGFVAAMACLILARDVLTLLMAWEAMSLFPAATILITSRDRAARRDLLIYLGTAHLAGVGVWLGLLYLAASGSGDLAAIAPVPWGIAALMAVGCAAKAGLAPLHFWLPRAHPLAPPPISALMSGVMIAMPFYLLIRFAFEWAGPLPAGLGYALAAAGALTALLGAYSAVMAGEMKRLLAFSSIENMGFAAVALGLAIVLAGEGQDRVAALALAACVFGLGAHGLAKATLFIATGPLGRLAGGLDLDRLGGIIREIPGTVGLVSLAAVSLAALPPLAGFAAEWTLLQAVIGATNLNGIGGLVVVAFAVAIGLAAGLAAFAFCKLIGLGLLGGPRRASIRNAGPIAVTAQAAMAGTVCLLIGLGLAAGWVLPWLITDLAGPVLGGDGGRTAGSVEFRVPGSGGMSLIVLTGVLMLVGGAIWRLRGAGRAAPAPTWICGQPQAPALRWSGAGFVKTLRLATTPRPGLEREVHGEGPGRRIRHSGEDPHPFESRLHRPAFAAVTGLTARARALQSGRLRTYLVYMVATLLVTLAAARIGVL